MNKTSVVYRPLLSAIQKTLSINCQAQHASCLLDDYLLWECAEEWITVVEFFPLQPSTGLLQAIRRLSPTSQKSHVVFVFRQSEFITAEYTRVNRDAHIATCRRMAEEIQRTGRADIESIAVVGGQNVKGTLMPSFVAKQRIETEDSCSSPRLANILLRPRGPRRGRLSLPAGRLTIPRTNSYALT